MPDEPKTPPAGPPQGQTPQGQAPQFAMDTGSISTVYTNFCHVTFLPEELILDFGLTTQMPPLPNVPVKLTHRVVMNFYTAKRLLHGLNFAVSRFESAFGELELDVQKRARFMQQPMPRPGTGLGGPPQ
jgi:Protein of unknown function (DUF3467)